MKISFDTTYYIAKNKFKTTIQRAGFFFLFLISRNLFKLLKKNINGVS